MFTELPVKYSCQYSSSLTETKCIIELILPLRTDNKTGRIFEVSVL